MYVSARIVRNSLLCSFIFASASAFQIANAKRSVMYTVPYKGSVYGVVPKNAAAAEAMEQWSVNSRKVRTTGYGAAASATASRSSYGFVGRMTVSRAFFQAWLAYEIGSIGLEWIRQQYAEMPNTTFDPETLEYQQNLKTSAGTCIEGTPCSWCKWSPQNNECGYSSGISALQAIMNESKPSNGYMIYSNLECNAIQCNIDVKEYNNNGQEVSGGRYYASGINTEGNMIYTQQSIFNKYPAGEPTLDPDPYLTAAILDRWAHIVPEMRQRVSDTVDFVPSPARYTEKDVLGNVLKDFEGVLEPAEEPIANPHKTAKRPAPEIEPTPKLKTIDLLNGNEITQPTEPIKEPITKEDLTKLPASDKEVDLSKIEDAVTKIGADPAETPIPELELQEWGEIEIPTPEATDEQINEQAGKIRRTVTEEQVIAKAESLIGMHTFNYETFGNSRACPPPRKMRFLTVEFDLPFDLYCDYIKQIVLLMIGLIPLGVFIYFLKNLFIHG